MNINYINKILNIRFRVSRTRIANQAKHRARCRRLLDIKAGKEHIKLLEQGKFRCELYENYYRRLKYYGNHKSILIEGEFGIETKNGEKEFFKIANEMYSTKASKITFNFTKAKRIYPTGITLLCSFQQMIIARTIKNKGRPKIVSWMNNEKASKYLYESGFNNYVGIVNDSQDKIYNCNTVVKIVHEKARYIEQAQEREKEILSFIKEFSSLDSQGMRLFFGAILVETFNNVIEHGVPFCDAGWWTMAEYIPELNAVSFCIADNGIGIRNSLATGPQREFILSQIENCDINEGKYIKKAFDLTVSGALTATVKKKRGVWQLFKINQLSGAQRGNGLDWIRRVCARLKISLTILSNSGYYWFDGNTSEEFVRGFNLPIFSGTMYHFLIPGKKVSV